MLEPEQLEALRSVEQKTGAAVAEQIRRAVDLWLAEQGIKKAASRRASPRRKA